MNQRYLDSLVSILTRQLGKGQQFTADTKLGDLGLDSLDAVELTMEVEEEHDINIPDEVVGGLENNQQMTLGELSDKLAAFIQEH